MANVGAVVTHAWEVKNGSGSALTGLAGNMSCVLTRLLDGGGSTAASETVTIAEIGSTGIYTIRYTPTQADIYIGRVTESSLGLEYYFEDDVEVATSTVPAAYAYCSEADVVAFAQMGDYTASTRPTEAQVTGFMSKRAAEVYSILVRWLGSDAPGPSGYDATINTSGDVGLALSYHCAMANALGAAMDALAAAGAGEESSASDRVQQLGTAYRNALENLKHLAREYAGSSAWSSTHISSGEMTSRTINPRAESLTFDEGTAW